MANPSEYDEYNFYKKDLIALVLVLKQRIEALEVAANGQRQSDYKEMVVGTLGQNFERDRADDIYQWLTTPKTMEEITNG